MRLYDSYSAVQAAKNNSAGDENMDLFLIHTRFQIAAICVFLVVVYCYTHTKKLPLLSTRCFSAMLVIDGVYLIFDILSVYTITNPNLVGGSFNRYVHRAFYILLMAVILCGYFYMLFLGRSQKHISKAKVLISFIPIVLGTLGVFFLKFEYVVDEATGMAYSTGPAVYVLYAMILTYIAAMLNATSNLSSKRARINVRIGICIWIAAAFIQAFFKPYLVSGLATVLLILFMYLSFENPSELIDHETNAFNKRGFRLVLGEEYAKKREFYIVNIALDDLSLVEQRFGHAKKNRILGTLAGLLYEASASRVYRTRGSTLSILYTGYDVNKLTERIVEILNTEWSMDCVTNIKISSHVDIIQCPKYADSADHVCDIMNHLSEFRSKVHDTCYVRVVDDELIKAKERYATIEEMVKLAIVNDGFEVVFQPIYSTVDKCFSSAEALVRLKDKKTIGFVSPDEFIPIAERCEVIGELGNIVIEKVCKFASENSLIEKGVKYIEVNLSGIQSIDVELPKTMLGILGKYNIPPSFINFEITETASVESGEQLRVNMNALKEMGSSFSMDDFGTGYSNLSQMAKVRYDLIKLDRSLIWPCFDETDDGREQAKIILHNIVKMVLSLKVGIVAEGVETKEQFEFLESLGVEHMQGYYFSRPVPGKDYLKFILSNNKAA